MTNIYCEKCGQWWSNERFNSCWNCAAQEKVEKKVKPKESSFSKLVKIKGIGEETVKDIERAYSDEEKLIEALKKEEVPLRNDIVDLLKGYYNLD
uniref:Uncharacterized protein n=1 Tax=viral metagenome TaxID=1070528 RepID=A0A6H1ZYA3_9ZZZZ